MVQNPNVDPVGSCVGVNGSRVNAVVSELNGEKIDIINWSKNPANLIENALSPAKVVYVAADAEEKQHRLLYLITSYHLQSDEKDRMQDLQQGLQVSRLILRASHRQGIWDSLMK